MAKTYIYLDNQGVYRGSKSGRIVKEIDPKRHEVVSPAVYAGERAAYRDAARARLDAARAVRSETAAARKEETKAAKAAARAAKPRKAKPVGIRAAAAEYHEKTKAVYMEADLPYDGPADMNTSRMVIKLHKLNPAFYHQFEDHRRTVGAHYFKYNPISHGFELYNHRQVYKGTFQLPIVLRSKKVVGPVQSYGRSKYREGPTEIYRPSDHGIQGGFAPTIIRPPGNGRVYM